MTEHQIILMLFRPKNDASRGSYNNGYNTRNHSYKRTSVPQTPFLPLGPSRSSLLLPAPLFCALSAAFALIDMLLAISAACGGSVKVLACCTASSRPRTLQTANCEPIVGFEETCNGAGCLGYENPMMFCQARVEHRRLTR